MLTNRSQWICPPGPAADGLRIGLLGGSFNPSHQGHVHISETALKTLALDYVWWLVSPQNPLKPAKGMASLDERYAAARRMAGQRRVIATAIERQIGTLYTVDTLTLLKERFSSVRFVWLMGSDNLVQIPQWRDWRHIFSLVPVAVVTRPGTALKARTGIAAQTFSNAHAPANKLFALRRPPAWTIIETHRHPASATAIRAKR